MTRTTRTIAICAYCIAFSALALAAQQPWRIASPAAWVTVATQLPPDESAKVEQGQSDYLLVDRQVRIGSVTERYTRYAERLVNQESVDDGAQLNFEFDPVHERITVHEVRVRRDGRFIDKLADSRRSLLNRETGLDDGLIDGRVTLHVLLQDIRVGDTLDYSYTIERRDPISERGYSDWFTTQWNVPVRQFRLRVLNAENRPLHVRDFGKLGEPQIRHSGGWIERTWDARDVVALPNEEDRPSWHMLYPRIELTEFADWGAVRAWAEPLYVVAPGNDAQLQSLIADIKAVPDESARILKALRFVQDDIRYTGLEIGAGAYRPTPPATVLARRFGDCKDKVLLFTAVLRALGIEAYPALVHSSLGRGLAERSPSPGAFNHVIAKVRSKGRDYWLDATANGQGGALESVTQADFGLALVVAPDSTALEKIPTVSPEHPSIEVTETFDFRKGTGKTATFKVLSEYRYAEADSMRATLRTTTASKLGAEYLDYYRKRYPGLSLKNPLATRDDRERNVVVVEESYEIATPFAPNDAGKRKFRLEAYAIIDRSRTPKQTVRSTPLARDFPLDVRQRIVAYLPSSWNLAPDEVDIENDAFSYHSTVKFHDGKLELDYRLRNTADHVALAALPAFLRQLENVNDDGYYTLTERNAAAKSNNLKPSPAFAMATALGLAIGGALFTYLWNLNRAPRPAKPGAPVGLLGWMFLPAIGTVLGPFAVSMAWFQWAKSVGTEPAFSGQADHLRLLVLGLAILLSAMFLNTLVQAILMFRRRNSFPRVFVLTQLMAILLALLVFMIKLTRDQPTGYFLLGTIAEAGWHLVIAGGWIAYMLLSQRVRATFTRPPHAASNYGLK